MSRPVKCPCCGWRLTPLPKCRDCDEPVAIGKGGRACVRCVTHRVEARRAKDTRWRNQNKDLKNAIGRHWYREQKRKVLKRAA